MQPQTIRLTDRRLPKSAALLSLLFGSLLAVNATAQIGPEQKNEDPPAKEDPLASRTDLSGVWIGVLQQDDRALSPQQHPSAKSDLPTTAAVKAIFDDQGNGLKLEDAYGRQWDLANALADVIVLETGAFMVKWDRTDSVAGSAILVGRMDSSASEISGEYRIWSFYDPAHNYALDPASGSPSAAGLGNLGGPGGLVPEEDPSNQGGGQRATNGGDVPTESQGRFRMFRADVLGVPNDVELDLAAPQPRSSSASAAVSVQMEARDEMGMTYLRPLDRAGATDPLYLHEIGISVSQTESASLVGASNRSSSASAAAAVELEGMDWAAGIGQAEPKKRDERKDAGLYEASFRAGGAIYVNYPSGTKIYLRILPPAPTEPFFRAIAFEIEKSEKTPELHQAWDVSTDPL